jgi:hypothetical protein
VSRPPSTATSKLGGVKNWYGESTRSAGSCPAPAFWPSPRSLAIRSSRSWIGSFSSALSEIESASGVIVKRTGRMCCKAEARM